MPLIVLYSNQQKVSMENILIPKGDISAQADLIKMHMEMLRGAYPDNPVMLVCEANMSCEFLLGVFICNLVFLL